jgi:ribosomal protein S18 acetylase RimI-like enzyme
MNSMTIRQATIHDLAALQAISRKTFAETFSEGNTEADMATYLKDGFSEEKLSAEIQFQNALFYFAENGDELLGYLKVNFGDAQTEKQDPNALEIERIYVLQQFQGMTVGQKLYAHAYAIALARNAPYIWLGVWEKNQRAIGFYQKQGFVSFDQHIFHLGDDAQTDILMKLNLAD